MSVAGACAQERLELVNCMKENAESRIACEVRAGLTARRKTLPSKYFYDARGSQLFEQICLLPEYYVTRTEMALLEEVAPKIVDGFDNGDLVELGSGANWKIRTLLEALGEDGRARTRYVPVDVSESALVEAANELLGLYPELDVKGVVADFTCDLHELPSDRRKILLFFGSTIGNLSTEEASIFLSEVRRSMRDGDRLLLGMDMVKPRAVLEAAYNDSEEVTAAFNKNVLHVLNRELSADFDPDHFDHVAFYNEDKQRVEMHLRANRDVEVNIEDLEIVMNLSKGESIHTEICRKFTPESAKAMLEESGLAIKTMHTDERNWFSLAETVRR